LPGPTIKQNVFNELDELGLLISQPRLAGERNAAYKQRLASVFADRANSTYRGLINGITRGLGLSLYDSIEIAPIEVLDVYVATNPGIIINESFVYLYDDIQDPVNGLDRKIDRFDKLGTAVFVTDLVDRINESTFFTATILSGVDSYSRSMTLLNQKSHVQITTELVPSSNRFPLENQNIINGTLFFSDRVRFEVEVLTEIAVNAPGKYFIDYRKGIVQVFDPAAPNTTVRYEYLQIPMTCKASPVIIYNMQDQDFKVKMFEQILADDGSFVNGLSTPLGADLINELLSVFPGYWGE
jgi:hypothetical protein